MEVPLLVGLTWCNHTSSSGTPWKGIFNPDLEYELSSWTDRPTWTVKLKCWVCLFNLKVSTQSWVKIVSWQFVSYGCFFFIGWFLARARMMVPCKWVLERWLQPVQAPFTCNHQSSCVSRIMMYSCYHVTVVNHLVVPRLHVTWLHHYPNWTHSFLWYQLFGQQVPIGTKKECPVKIYLLINRLVRKLVMCFLS